MGIVIKKYLVNIISISNTKLQYNQWRSASTVIEWFKDIKDKAKCRFIKFDIADFYLSISMELPHRSISFAKSLIDIERNIINTINHARKSLLFDDTGTWIKKIGIRYSMSQWEASTMQKCVDLLDCTFLIRANPSWVLAM